LFLLCCHSGIMHRWWVAGCSILNSDSHKNATLSHGTRAHFQSMPDIKNEHRGYESVHPS
jgi:hypothetical protein